MHKIFIFDTFQFLSRDKLLELPCVGRINDKIDV